jgi:hypothetical protein
MFKNATILGYHFLAAPKLMQPWSESRLYRNKPIFYLKSRLIATDTFLLRYGEIGHKTTCPIRNRNHLDLFVLRIPGNLQHRPDFYTLTGKIVAQ